MADAKNSREKNRERSETGGQADVSIIAQTVPVIRDIFNLCEIREVIKNQLQYCYDVITSIGAVNIFILSSQNFFSYITAFLGILCIEVSADLHSIVGGKNGTAYHHLTVNVIFTEQLYSFLHTRESSCHKSR